MKNKTIVSILLLFAITLVACKKNNIEKNLHFPEITFLDKSTSLKSEVTSNVDVLYFGGLSIVAYHYRPGQAIQNRVGDAAYYEGKPLNWSYFLFVSPGYEEARSVLLNKSGEINIADYLHVSYNDAVWDFVDKKYVEQVDTFKVDMFEVRLDGSAVLKNNKFYGCSPCMVADSANFRKKYPTYSNRNKYMAYTYWKGIDTISGSISIMFVNDAYISTPLQVKVRNYKNTGETGWLDSYVIDKTTRTITDAERNFILSFLNENGYLINSYQYINFIPFNTNKVWTFSSNNALNEIKVAFNLDEIIDPKTNITGIEELGAVNQLPFDTLFYKANSNFIPFGLEIQF